MLKLIMHFTNGIPYAPPAAPGFQCGWIEVQGGIPPFSAKMVRGKGDTHNKFFKVVPQYDGKQLGVLSAVQWNVPPCPDRAPISIRVKVTDGNGNTVTSPVAVL